MSPKFIEGRIEWRCRESDPGARRNTYTHLQGVGRSIVLNIARYERTMPRDIGLSFFRLFYGVIGKPDPMYMTLVLVYRIPTRRTVAEAYAKARPRLFT